VGAPPTIRWATITDFQLADPPHPTLHWIDDPQRGIGQRKIERIEDLLGAEGMIQKYRYRFEQILGSSPTWVVYALLNPESASRLAYSFKRECIEGEGQEDGSTGAAKV
jgi:hypothetical protein